MSTIAKKLRIKEGMSILALHAPEDFASYLSLPSGIKILSKPSANFDQIHWFVKDKAQLEGEVDMVVKLLKEQIICWCYYPKSSSRLQTNISRDKGWESLLKHPVTWLSLVSFNDTWSAFAVRLINPNDKVKETKTIPREIDSFIDPVARTIRLPADLEVELKKNKIEYNFFNTLSYTNRKEYVEWIVSARSELTRNNRITGTIERLSEGWRNPQNR